MALAKLTKRGCKLKLTDEEAQFLRNLLGMSCNPPEGFRVFNELENCYNSSYTGSEAGLDTTVAIGPVRRITHW